LKYIDGERQTDIEGWEEGYAVKNVRRTWKRKQRGYSNIGDLEEDAREDWRILGQAHSLTWDWSQESG
jgi:hypothetical protein